MRRRWMTRGLIVLALAAAGSLSAVDPPHWTNNTVTIGCIGDCHALHGVIGSVLIVAPSNVNSCQSCHNPSGKASALPIDNADKAVPGSWGTSHAFDVAADNVDLDVHAPTNTEMSLRVMGGKIVCSTCHDQHEAESSFGGTPRISAAEQIVDDALSDGTLTSGGTYTGSAGAWYHVEILADGGPTSATFQYRAYDDVGGWSGWTGPLTASDSAQALGTDGVEVTFGGTDFAAGEAWQFSASWPFLRAALDQGDNAAAEKFCRDCHSDWTMTHDGVGGTRDWDGNYKSHPVGVTMGASYDRAVPLDGNGAAQGPHGASDVDGNPSNDIRLFESGGQYHVQCLSCHAVHFADSNTLSGGSR